MSICESEALPALAVHLLATLGASFLLVRIARGRVVGAVGGWIVGLTLVLATSGFWFHAGVYRENLLNANLWDPPFSRFAAWGLPVVTAIVTALLTPARAGANPQAYPARLDRFVATALRRRRTWVISVVLLIAIWPSFSVTVGRRSHLLCLNCGTTRLERIMFGIDFSVDHRQPMTDWYDRRIGGSHAHRWRSVNCTAYLTVWQQPRGFACPVIEPLEELHDRLPDILNRLEGLDLDRAYHERVTAEDYNARAAAVTTGYAFRPSWSDDEVRKWWEDTKAFLSSPKLWEAGFRNSRRAK
jgi:hypothetical protein